MSSYRNDRQAPHADAGAANGSASGEHASDYETTLRGGKARNPIGADGPDVGAVDSYRRWLNRVEAPERRRSPTDPALYTWKGYRNWSDKVRRGWKQDE